MSIEFYDYYNHLKGFDFKCENDLLKYEITLSADQKQIEKKICASWTTYQKIPYQLKFKAFYNPLMLTT